MYVLYICMYNLKNIVYIQFHSLQDHHSSQHVTRYLVVFLTILFTKTYLLQYLYLEYVVGHRPISCFLGKIYVLNLYLLLMWL